MSTDTSISDLEAVLKSISEDLPISPTLREKALVASKEIQEEIERAYGKIEVAVDLIREVREE